MEYNFREIEKTWQAFWKEKKTFKTENESSKPKYYVLDMFPYPSGAGLHVGHPLGYIASDIYARYKRLQGFNVLHPMGYDSFGLPAEQYAIQTGQHPARTTTINIDGCLDENGNLKLEFIDEGGSIKKEALIDKSLDTHMYDKDYRNNVIKGYRNQLDKIGFSFDWDREVRTSSPEYYKWTQWIFIQLFKSWYNPVKNKAESIDNLITLFETKGFNGCFDDKLTGDIEQDLPTFSAEEWKNFDERKKQDLLMNFRLAYLSEAYVNWCPALGTVLANDEVKDGISERGGHPVERKLMKQWSLRITAYSERLLTGLDQIDWTDSIKEAQRNWIGKSEGCSLKFELKGFAGKYIEVFTTRPDTIFGVSYLTLAPELDLVNEITSQDHRPKVAEYIDYAKNRSERERQADVKKITGEFTGAYAIHPFTKEEIPVWVGDYVLVGYGTGAVMAVPAHDTRDFSFAKHFKLPIKQVVETPQAWDLEKEAYTEKLGKVINSDFLNGLQVKEAIKKCIQRTEEMGVGKGKTNYRLRDAVFGRQRYWGEPIPIYYKDGIPYAVDEKDLPITLPEVDKYLPTEDGEPPLARATNWKYMPHSNSPQGGEDKKYSWQTAAPSSWEVMKERASGHRKNQTEAEQILWMQLKNKQLDNKFRRQQVIGNNIADFVCLEKKLVIEVDGKIHDFQKEHDEARTKELESFGFSVIRFTNSEVIADVENVVSKIKIELESKVLPAGEDLGGAYPYEHTTMPGWAGSSWYFLRYMDAKNPTEFASKKATDYWNQIDLYMGGAEHATGHLLYFRFWTKFLFDLGLISFEEPAKKLINQGMIQGVSRYIYRHKTLKQLLSKNRVQDSDEFQKALKNEREGVISKSLVTQIIAPIESTDGDKLDIELFKKLKPEFKDYTFTGENDSETLFICDLVVEKMSKSKYNVVTPDDLCEKYGADTLRLYEMFLGPLEDHKPWSTQGIEGTHRFLKKLWRLFNFDEKGMAQLSNDAPSKAELKVLHRTIKKITNDLDRYSFNTPVSEFMICTNELSDLKCNKKEILEPLVILLSPFAPHIAEELWKSLGHIEKSVTYAKFPSYNETFLVEDSFAYPVSYNGKTRFFLELSTSLSKEDVEKEVMANEQTAKWLEGNAPKKIIVVPKKIVNIVV